MVKVVKAIKKHPSLLVIHLSNTFVIEKDCELQGYIAKKLSIE